MILAALATALSGCGDKEKPHTPDISQVLPNLPLPPSARVLSREGGDEALQLTFASEVGQEQVANYYRRTLSRNPWTLVNDTKTVDGAIALYAERKGPPLWVTIRADSLGTGSVVTLAGAQARSDSVAASDSATPRRDSTPPR